jgi:hypothetical protein
MTSLPALDEQLVLELEGRISVDEAVDVFPGSGCRWFSLPMHQHLADSSGQAGACSTFRHWLCGAMMSGQQGRRHRWWSAHELLQEADVKDVVETCAGTELEGVSDVVDDSHHPIGPVETGPELPFGRHLQGGWSAMT